MTWKHTGKVSAFDAMTLDAAKAQELGIEGFKKSDSPIKITQQALNMLQVLNAYDQTQILKEIRQIIRNPNRQSSIKHSRNFMRRIDRMKIPFRNYHFLIKYDTTYGVTIDDIMFDRELYGSQKPYSLERTMMYHVTQNPNGTQYDGPKTQRQLTAFEDQWESVPTASARTQHISVNGMQNELRKAQWLMGIHTQVAYQKDDVKKYTLFHNPSDGMALDFVECIFDTGIGRKSHNAQQLAAVIAQQAEKPTKWTVHSQGAIIFLAALKLFNRRYLRPLNSHKLAIHGSGAKLNDLTQRAKDIGMKIASVRNNPFDLVPNVLGRNNLGLSSLARCMAFGKLVKSGGIGESPHTLPYLGIETYYQQLQILGQHDKAQKVAKYIENQCK